MPVVVPGKRCYIYGLACVATGYIVYVGQSVSPGRRLGQHIRDCRNPRNKQPLYVWLRAYEGRWDGIDQVILETTVTEDAHRREQYWKRVCKAKYGPLLFMGWY